MTLRSVLALLNTGKFTPHSPHSKHYLLSIDIYKELSMGRDDAELLTNMEDEYLDAEVSQLFNNYLEMSEVMCY